MQTLASLQPGEIYHVFNRGNGRANLFLEERNYHFFLQLYWRHLGVAVDTFAYCLMPNHFHLLLRVKANEPPGVQLRAPRSLSASRQFANLFNAYAKAVNRTYGRSGSLFQKPFRRVAVQTHMQLLTVLRYIHRNPQRHGFVTDFRAYPHSSYAALRAETPTQLARTEVLGWFGSINEIDRFHQAADDDAASGIDIGNDGNR